MVQRAFNLSPGPAILPLPALEQARQDIIDYRGTGIGVMELSHRGPEFEAILAETEALLRELLGIPASYKVLFTTGGAHQQFSMVPMNLLTEGLTGNYLLSGLWAEKACDEGRKFGSVHVAGSTKEEGYRKLPQIESISRGAAYLHYCSNNTVIGSQFPTEPDCGDVPLVCDASSDLLSRPIPIERYGLIYAGAQKNLGPAGVTIVVVREDLLSRSRDDLPLMMSYTTYAKSASLFNTPPTFPIYMVCQVLRWIKAEGGLAEMERRNEEKAKLVYDVLDSHAVFVPVVDRGSRSKMNVTFRLRDESLEKELLRLTEARGLPGLKGHRMVGGFRASMYNAFPIEGARALCDALIEFAERHR